MFCLFGLNLCSSTDLALTFNFRSSSWGSCIYSNYLGFNSSLVYCNWDLLLIFSESLCILGVGSIACKMYEAYSLFYSNFNYTFLWTFISITHSFIYSFYLSIQALIEIIDSNFFFSVWFLLMIEIRPSLFCIFLFYNIILLIFYIKL